MKSHILSVSGENWVCFSVCAGVCVYASVRVRVLVSVSVSVSVRDSQGERLLRVKES
jgi:hypothetical protein